MAKARRFFDDTDYVVCLLITPTLHTHAQRLPHPPTFTGKTFTDGSKTTKLATIFRSCCSTVYKLLLYSIQVAALQYTSCCSTVYKLLLYSIQVAALQYTSCCSTVYKLLLYSIQVAALQYTSCCSTVYKLPYRIKVTRNLGICTCNLGIVKMRTTL